MEQAVIHSPLGPLTLFAEDDHLTALVYGDYGSYDDLPLFREAKRQLEAYFAGQRQAFSAEAGRALHSRVQTAQTGGKTGGESPVRRCPTSRPAGLLSGERRLAGFPSEKPLSQAKRCLGQGFAVFEMERDRKETGAPLGINVCLSGGSPLARLSALLAHHPGIRRMTRSKAPFSGQPYRPRL